MKQYFFAVLLLGAGFFYGCKEKEAQVKEMATTVSEVSKAQRNINTVADLFDKWNKQEIDAAFANFAPDFKEYSNGGVPPTDAAGMKASLRNWLVGFPDYRGSDFTYVAEDNVVMVWGRWSGTWKGEMLGQKPTGKQLSYYDVDIFRLNDDGRITEHHNIVPLRTVVKQVGLKME